MEEYNGNCLDIDSSSSETSKIENVIIMDEMKFEPEICIHDLSQNNGIRETYNTNCNFESNSSIKSNIDISEILQQTYDSATIKHTDFQMNLQQPCENFTNESRLENMENRLNKIETSLSNLETNTNKILGLLTNIDKWMSVQYTENFVNGTDMDITDNDYSFNMVKCETEKDLLDLNERLEDINFQEKFINYWKSRLVLNGKNDGSMIFRTIIRDIISTSAIKNYSWKGISRSTRSECSAFQVVFRNLIQFINHVCKIADNSFTIERTNQEFIKFLRFKNIQATRDANRKNLPRQSTSRTKKSTIPNVTKKLESPIKSNKRNENLNSV